MTYLRDIVYGKQIRPVHPGRVLLDVLKDMGMTPIVFADLLGISCCTFDEIIQGRSPITVDIAIRIGKALGNSPQPWLHLQQKVDIWDAIQTHREDYDGVSAVA